MGTEIKHRQETQEEEGQQRVQADSDVQEAQATEITPEEEARFARLEKIVERGKRRYIEVGQALDEIRSARLYRRDYADFDTYLRERWGLSRSYAARLSEAAAVARMLPIGNVPTNEAQARALTPLLGEPEKAREVWRKAKRAGEGKPTAARLRTEVAKLRPPAPPRDREAHMRRVADHAASLILRGVAETVRVKENEGDWLWPNPRWRYRLGRARQQMKDVFAFLDQIAEAAQKSEAEIARLEQAKAKTARPKAKTAKMIAAKARRTV